MLPELLLDPAFCAECHPQHFKDWSGSMHAYASTDPVFLAMNARGQRETGGELGDFCVQCHAPMAVRTGATTDGLNLPELPDRLQGITCVFCHSVTAIEGTHNNPLTVSLDGTFRAAIADPQESPAHPSAYSAIHDSREAASAALCGSCHDVVTPGGHALERTFAEWKQTQYAMGEHPSPCGNCHMPGYDGVASNADDAVVRRIHSHTMAAVDIAVVPFPERESQRLAVPASLNPTVWASLCVEAGSELSVVTVSLRNRFAAHGFPSGAAQDRRAWVELIAFKGETQQFSSGVVADGVALETLDDPDLWWLGDEIFDAAGQPVHMFWESVSHISHALLGPLSVDAQDPLFEQTTQRRSYSIDTDAISRVTMRLLLRPMNLAVIDSLVASGDLDPSLKSKLPTYSLANTELEWRAGQAGPCVTSPIR